MGVAGVADTAAGVVAAAGGMAVGVAAVGMAVGVAAVAITAGAVGLLRFTAEVAAGMAEAVATMVLPMVPWPTWVMGGVVTAACIHTSLPII
jgi:hypothetical protein